MAAKKGNKYSAGHLGRSQWREDYIKALREACSPKELWELAKQALALARGSDDGKLVLAVLKEFSDRLVGHPADADQAALTRDELVTQIEAEIAFQVEARAQQLAMERGGVAEHGEASVQ